MSTSTVPSALPLPFFARRTKAYFAPVNRSTGAPTIFDPAVYGGLVNHVPPQPWVDLGWITDFARSSESKISSVDTGMPSMVRLQARQTLEATVSFRFVCWSKLAMALSCGSEHMNVLASSGSVPMSGSGATAQQAVALQATSDPQTIYPATASPLPFSAGNLLVVDQDYAGQRGFIGAGVSGAYVQDPTVFAGNSDYTRRISFNVAKVASVTSNGGLQLVSPLAAGAPSSGMKVQHILGFVDREGGSFFQEWSALFILEGTQGESLSLYYPRLQTCQDSREFTSNIAASVQMVQLEASFRALPSTDLNDNQQVLCYRSYVPANAASI